MDPQPSSGLWIGDRGLFDQKQDQLGPLDKGMGYVTLPNKLPGLRKLLTRKLRTIERRWSRHGEVPP